MEKSYISKNINPYSGQSLLLEELKELELKLSGYLWALGSQSEMNKAHVVNMQQSNQSGIVALEDIDDHTGEIAQLAQSISRVLSTLQDEMTDTGRQTRTSRNQLQQMTDSIDMRRKRLDELQFLLKNMSARVIQVRGYINSLEDITARIDVLSINASIEAARAGDRGAGFKVVATEIKKLALSSRQFSDQIVVELKSMDSQNSEILQAMEIFQNEQLEIAEELRSGSVSWNQCDLQITEALENLSSISLMVEEQKEKTRRLNEKTEVLLRKQEQNNRASLLMEKSLTKEAEILGQLTISNNSLGEKLSMHRNDRQDQNSYETSASILRIGHDMAYPPWVYLHQGKSEGISIDYAGQIAEYTEKELKFDANQWGTLIRRLDEGEIDLIANVGWPNRALMEGPYCVSIPYARFEVCYFESAHEMLGSTETPRIFSQRGSYAKDFIKQGDGESHFEDNDILNFVQLIWQKADKVITDRSVGNYLSRNYFAGQIEAEEANEGFLDVVFLCRQENRALIEEINQAIRDLGPVQTGADTTETRELVHSAV